MEVIKNSPDYDLLLIIQVKIHRKYETPRKTNNLDNLEEFFP